MNISNRLLIPAGISVLIAACGGGSPTTNAADSHRSPLAYSECMHAHGVPNFPDPGPDGGIDKDKIIALGNSPQVNRASNACEHTMPASGLGPDRSAATAPSTLAELLAFARCIRAHGFPTFPDPTHGAKLTQQMITGAGIDLQQPALAQAADTCIPVTHGTITKATIARFVAGH